MRIRLITGGRHYKNRQKLRDVLDEEKPDMIVHGNCVTGADMLARQWASDNDKPQLVWPAEWDQHGHAAGPLRNEAMVRWVKQEEDLCRDDVKVIAFSGGDGTADCVAQARAAGLEVIEVSE